MDGLDFGAETQTRPDDKRRACRIFVSSACIRVRFSVLWLKKLSRLRSTSLGHL